MLITSLLYFQTWSSILCYYLPRRSTLTLRQYKGKSASFVRLEHSTEQVASRPTRLTTVQKTSTLQMADRTSLLLFGRCMTISLSLLPWFPFLLRLHRFWHVLLYLSQSRTLRALRTPWTVYKETTDQSSIVFYPRMDLSIRHLS